MSKLIACHMITFTRNIYINDIEQEDEEVDVKYKEVHTSTCTPQSERGVRLDGFLFQAKFTVGLLVKFQDFFFTKFLKSFFLHQ